MVSFPTASVLCQEHPQWATFSNMSTLGAGRVALRVLDNLLTLFSLADLAIALVLTITNTVAFSRCDKFSQASNLASSAMYSGGLARSLAGGMFSRLFNR